MIEIRHLSKTFEDSSTILKDINVKINKGDVIALIGHSGCGKSTLLRCLNLLNQPTGGEIILDGENILAPGYDKTKVRQKIGMVFQGYNLFNNMTVIENIMYAPMDLLKKSKQESYDIAIDLLKKVGLSSKALKYPHELSGGQKQRVAICRTLAMNPEVILFDEPTSALDPAMVEEIKSVILNLSKLDITMLIVSHDMDFVKSVSNRVFYVDEGIIYEDGTPSQIFDHPKKEKTRIFVKQLKQLSFEFENSDFDFSTAITTIDEYCYKYGLERKLSNTICLAFEELCKQILAPVIGKNKMKVIFEYSKKTKSVTMEVMYGGERFNPKKTNNKLSWKLFNKAISTYSYEETDDEYTNKILVQF